MKSYLSKLCRLGALCLIWSITPLALADDASDYSEFLAALDKLDNKKFRPLLIEELHQYLRRFQDTAGLDEIHFKLATEYDKHNKKPESFVTNLEVVYLYPDSGHFSTAQDRVRNLLIQEKKFRPLKDKMAEIVNPVPSDSTREAAHYSLIKKLYYYNFDFVSGALVSSCVRFMQHFPNSADLDEVNFWKAELLARDDQHVAALTEYLKMTYLYKGSVHVSASKLKIADLQTKKFKMHREAIATLDAFIEEFPDDPQAAFALVRKAEITTKKIKQHNQAILAYLDVPKNYPKSLEAVPALFAAAQLYESKIKDYNQAIQIYATVVADFKDDIKAPYALTESARIYEDRLKDYANAATVYEKVYQLFPDSDIAAESLYAAAEINEKKIKNSEAALTHYRTIVDKYPTTDIAEKANKRIAKLSRNSLK